MKLLALSIVVALLATSAVGCGCCRGTQTQTVAYPAAPACGPSCPPGPAL